MSENMKKETSSEHGFIVRERAHVEIRGMTEVLSFDEMNVALATTSGDMLIEGRELRVNVLDVKEGTVTVDGHIDSISYRDNDTREPSRGLLGRLFH
jgi:sporulation protein YabP